MRAPLFFNQLSLPRRLNTELPATANQFFLKQVSEISGCFCVSSEAEQEHLAEQRTADGHRQSQQSARESRGPEVLILHSFSICSTLPKGMTSWGTLRVNSSKLFTPSKTTVSLSKPALFVETLIQLAVK